MVKIIDGENFKNMMLAAAAVIEEKKQENFAEEIAKQLGK